MAGVCVVLPALAAVALQPDARAALAGGPLRGERRPHRALDLLVVGQAATSVALLVAAGTVVENAGRARRAEPGYALAPLVDLAFEHPSPQLVERLLADPRVESATTVAQTPLAGQAARIDVEVEGRRQRLAHNLVDHRFFAVTGIPIRRGRGFLPGDGAPEVRRAVVSESAAGRLWPGADPVGETIDVDEDGGEAAPARYEVVGVAADALSGWFFEGREVPMVYLAAPVASPLTAETIVRRRGGEAGALAGLRALCQAHDPAATCTPTPLQSLLDRQRVPFVVAAQVASALGLTSLALACLGLYGLVGFLVVRQTREIGVRMALGATRRGVLLGVLGAAARRMALGTALGLPVCLAALALLESRLTLLDTFHPGVFVLAPAALVAAGVVAALLPARRAASVDPLVALRHD
jgi:hypothetical protein